MDKTGLTKELLNNWGKVNLFARPRRFGNNVLPVTDNRFVPQFGFISEDVGLLLAYFHLEEKFDLIQKCYDGYRFGNTDVYCPWDVINYVSLLRADPEALPRAYWINSSGNDIIRAFIRMATPGTRHEIKSLIAGETVTRYGVACYKKKYKVLLTCFPPPAK